LYFPTCSLQIKNDVVHINKFSNHRYFLALLNGKNISMIQKETNKKPTGRAKPQKHQDCNNILKENPKDYRKQIEKEVNIKLDLHGAA
jgi:hypothetical protein